MEQLVDTALFAARFREAASRALLLPRRRPGSRTPLWQQRRRAADLLAVARQFGSFPIVLETYREILQDDFDLPALREVLGGIQSRRIRLAEVVTTSPSPFAASLLFDFVAAYLYEGDTPLAERRAAALTLDRDLLAELLGEGELRQLLDADVVGEVELELQALAEERRVKGLDGVHDLLMRLGPLTVDGVGARLAEGDAARPCSTSSPRRGAPSRYGSLALPPGPPSRTAPACAMRSVSSPRPASPSPSSSRCPTRWATSLAGLPGPMDRSARPPLQLPSGWRRPWQEEPSSASNPRAAWCVGRSAPVATGWNGWTWRCCAGSSDARSPSSARRSSRWRPMHWGDSSPPGTEWAHPPPTVPDCPRSSASFKVPPSPLRHSRPMCSPLGSTIAQRTSTD